MKTSILTKIDELIKSYAKDHPGTKPLYIVLSPDETKLAREEIKENNGHPADYIVTEYKGMKLTEHPALLDGKAYLSNELPETGS